MKPTTREQREALWNLYQRQAPKRPYDKPQYETYTQFRRKAVQTHMDCVMVGPVWGMWFGIEPDGYTHS